MKLSAAAGMVLVLLLATAWKGLASSDSTARRAGDVHPMGVSQRREQTAPPAAASASTYEISTETPPGGSP